MPFWPKKNTHRCEPHLALRSKQTCLTCFSYDELIKEHKVTYVAGGASQNAARGAAVCLAYQSPKSQSDSQSETQYILPPKSVVYTGCVGDDELAQQLKAANKREGLDDVYQVKTGEKTGACAVIITGHHRFVRFYITIVYY